MRLILTATCLLFAKLLLAQEPAWDDTRPVHWDMAFQEVEIPSSIDGHLQKAFFYRTKKESPQPLIVSLHTWSGDFRQYDPLAAQCKVLDWNYIHPDFRGPNRSPDACGSPLAIADIDEAISYALKHANVAAEEVHVIGASGGGYATLYMYLNSQHRVKSFSAWVPIADLVDWYHESIGRGRKYAKDILMATSKGNSVLDEKEARLRSPQYMPLPNEEQRKSRLAIYAGIHDGYTGSVPITQSLRFYNRLVKAYGGKEKELISEADMLKLVGQRTFSTSSKNNFLGGREVHYARSFENISLTIFEGTHEMLVPEAFSHITCCNAENFSRTILTIGDSNGASKEGWVEQLKKIRRQDLVLNKSVSGNTIGFDNLEQERLNTLKNIDRYLQEVGMEVGKRPIDAILINLGTNDCKAVFHDRLPEVVKNMEVLIEKIQSFDFGQKTFSKIIIVSPPPYGSDKILKEKYKGGDFRVQKLLPEFSQLAKEKGIEFLNIYELLKPVYNDLAPDGVHMKKEGQKIIATAISQHLSAITFSKQ